MAKGMIYAGILVIVFESMRRKKYFILTLLVHLANLITLLSEELAFYLDVRRSRYGVGQLY